MKRVFIGMVLAAIMLAVGMASVRAQEYESIETNSVEAAASTLSADDLIMLRLFTPQYHTDCQLDSSNPEFVGYTNCRRRTPRGTFLWICSADPLCRDPIHEGHFFVGTYRNLVEVNVNTVPDQINGIPCGSFQGTLMQRFDQCCAASCARAE